MGFFLYIYIYIQLSPEGLLKSSPNKNQKIEIDFD
jgi:hypothetical protein